MLASVVNADGMACIIASSISAKISFAANIARFLNRPPPAPSSGCILSRLRLRISGAGVRLHRYQRRSLHLPWRERRDVAGLMVGQLDVGVEFRQVRELLYEAR